MSQPEQEPIIFHEFSEADFCISSLRETFEILDELEEIATEVYPDYIIYRTRNSLNI